MKSLWRQFREYLHRKKDDLAFRLGWGIHPLLKADRLRSRRRYRSAQRLEDSWQANRPVSSTSLVRAKHQIGDPAAWLASVNEFLTSQGLSPCTLEGTKPSLGALRSTVPAGSAHGDLVSIIVPVYRAEQTIDYALSSLQAQTWADWEVLVVDDASPDGTWGKLQEWSRKEPRIKIWRNRVNAGPYASKNRALSFAKGTWITGHDADDWAHPERIEHQVNSLRAAGAWGGMSWCVRVDAQGRWVLRENVPADKDGFLRACEISAMFDRAVFERLLGAWDAVRFGADSELLGRKQRLFPAGKWIELREALVLMLSDVSTLTGNPVTGIHRRKGLSPIRLEYGAAWKHWHAQPNASLRYEFPMQQRPFPAPAAMQVPWDDQREVMK